MTFTREQIRARATELALSAGVYDQFPVPLERIAEYLGYASLQFAPGTSTGEVSGAVNHQQRKIYVNATDSARRQMFTLAHEVGHVVLHGERFENFVDYRSNGNKDSRELEADSFAGELLMPEFHFRNTWTTWDGVASIVAATYGVSEQAAKVRASVLGSSIS